MKCYIFCSVFLLLISSVSFARYEFRNIDADTKVIYDQKLDQKSKKRVLNEVTGAGIKTIYDIQGNDKRHYVTGDTVDRDVFEALQKHVLPTIKLINRINSGELGSQKMPVVEQKRGRYKITALEKYHPHSNSVKDNFMGRDSEVDPFEFLKDAQYIVTPGKDTTTIPTGTTLGPHPTDTTSIDLKAQESPDLAHQEMMMEKIGNMSPTDSVNVGELYKDLYKSE